MFSTYRIWLEEQDLSHSTKRSYERAVANFCRFLSSKSALYPNPRLIEEYLCKLRNSYSSTSIAAILAALRSYCHFCGIAMPAVSIEKRVPLPTTLSSSQQQALVEALSSCTNCKTVAMIHVFLQCGLKMSELAALDVGDVSLAGPRIVIRAVKDNCARFLPLDETGTKALLVWLTRRRVISVNRVERALFVNNYGERISASGINSLIDALAAEITLPLNAQVLRNTCLKNFAMNRQSLQEAADLAGYTSTKSQYFLMRMLPH